MAAKINQHPEQKARDNIDKKLEYAGWVIQEMSTINLWANTGVAVKEYLTDAGPADYVLFVNQTPVGIVEAKREDEGQHLIQVEDQSKKYAEAKLRYLNNDVLPFVYESTGIITNFTDNRDPKPRSRYVYSFHRPETLVEWLKQDKTLRSRFSDIPNLDETGLRPAQINAINNLETSFKNNKPRALIQMATGAGKTFTAATFMYRLLKHANAKRILFLVDTKNLGEQAEQELMKFQPTDDNRKFTELYNVQRLSSSYIANDSQICISTIQRLYSILKGEELADGAEDSNPHESTWMQQKMKENQAVPVAYNEKVPIEQFDFIVIDECHRSIYNLWKQVLDYFDAFLIGLTATPDKRTYGFFNQNVVSEYTFEESITDGVNVPYDVYSIETEVSQKGAIVKSGWYIDRRNKLTREKKWDREDEDTYYGKNDLDKKVVNPSQIRAIIKEFYVALQRDIYPNRIDEEGNYEVPKTLIFAKTDSHADDIIKIVREEFNEGNDFCKKVTYKIDEDPKSVLNKFRNSYYPRIAVTVDMIATGTDVKPLEVLLFMRDVKSINYFEQMKGRGTRTINADDLQMVSKTAHTKTHFVIVDAIGATKSKKTDSRPLERKPTIPLKDLLQAVAVGAADEDLFLSLANRLIRLDKQITEKQAEKVIELSGGKNLKQITKELLNAYDVDVIESEATILKEKENLPSVDFAQQKTQGILISQEASTFNGTLNDYLDTVRRQVDQIIDSVNIDEVTKSSWDTESGDKAQKLVFEFEQYLAEHKDEITALQIFYNQPYNLRNITFSMIQEVLEKLKQDKPLLAPHAVWNAYAELDNTVSSSPINDLVTLVSLIRKVTGIDKTLLPYDSVVNKNFQDWVFKKHKGAGTKFSVEQMNWLRMIKDHITTSFHIDVDDLDYTPFDAQGGRGKMWQLFGDDMTSLIDELNEVLIA